MHVSLLLISAWAWCAIWGLWHAFFVHGCTGSDLLIAPSLLAEDTLFVRLYILINLTMDTLFNLSDGGDLFNQMSWVLLRLWTRASFFKAIYNRVLFLLTENLIGLGEVDL